MGSFCFEIMKLWDNSFFRYLMDFVFKLDGTPSFQLIILISSLVLTWRAHVCDEMHRRHFRETYPGRAALSATENYALQRQKWTLKRIEINIWQRMPYSGTLRRGAHVRTDVSEERTASIIRVTRICQLVRALVLTSNVVTISPILVTLMVQEICSSETSFLTRLTRCHTPFRSRRRGNIKSYHFFQYCNGHICDGVQLVQ
jgi:hypothetical protein